jgi:hypothetical protein
MSCGPRESYARCEGNEAVYHRSDDSVLTRISCASDEQCVEFGPKTAVCRLLETCANKPTAACSGDNLLICNPWETFRERIDCTIDNSGKPVSGRCVTDTLSGPACVDWDAVACFDYAFKDFCFEDWRGVCRDGYTSQELACRRDQEAGGGTCRINVDSRAVCAQTDAAVCDPTVWYPACQDASTLVECVDGFVWTTPCPPGQQCADQNSGDVVFPVCG